MQTHVENVVDLVLFSDIIATQAIAKLAVNKTKSTRITACVYIVLGFL